MALATFLDPVFDPILNLGPFWAIVIMAFLLSLLISVVYMFATDQKKMKALKDELKSYQAKTKALKDDPAQAMAVQKEAMAKNMEYMKMSFKPTLYTFIPIILIFGWMNANLAYEPIYPGEQFNIEIAFEEYAEGLVEIDTPSAIKVMGDTKTNIKDSKALFKLESEHPGDYAFDVNYNGKTYTKEVRITDKFSYLNPITLFEGDIKSIEVKHNEVKPLGSFSIFGWQPGWLGTYIIFSLVFSMVIRKILKIY